MADDKQLYRVAWEEFEKGTVDTALWAKAFASSRGDENATKSEYIRLRVAEMRTAGVLDRVRSVKAGAEAGWEEIKRVLQRIVWSAVIGMLLGVPLILGLGALLLAFLDVPLDSFSEAEDGAFLLLALWGVVTYVVYHIEGFHAQ